jgi:hypothetical protein
MREGTPAECSGSRRIRDRAALHGEIQAFNPISVGLDEHIFTRTVHFWINEILMVVFFFVVGLEVRRELFEGELSTPRRAALPVAAALGGMLVPAAIYMSLNAGSPAVRGWGFRWARDRDSPSNAASRGAIRSSMSHQASWSGAGCCTSGFTQPSRV